MVRPEIDSTTGGVNTYSYVVGNPLGFTDPTGELSIAACANPVNAPACIAAGIVVGPISSAIVAAGINAAIQYSQNQCIDPIQVMHVAGDAVPLGMIVGPLGGLRALFPTKPVAAPTTASVTGNTIVVSPGGSAIIVPRGATGPVPIAPGGTITGFGYTGGSGGLGLDPRVSGVRIMNPTPPRGPSPGYPSGHVVYSNATGQGVNPFTGRTISNSDPMRHIPLTPP